MSNAPHLLSETQVESYYRDGFVVPDFALPAQKLDAIRGAMKELIAAYPRIPTEGLVSPHCRYMGTDRPDIRDTFLGLCRVSEVLDITQQLIGSNIILWGSRIFSKAARAGRASLWHQDGEYWPIRPLATTTAWIAIDKATEENGCLQFVRGSHATRTPMRHESLSGQGAALDKEIAPNEFDSAHIVSVTLDPGRMVFFDVYTAHGARPNTSSRRRAGFAIRYMPGSSLYDRGMQVGSGQDDVQADLSKRALFLLGGEDRTGKNDCEVGHEGMLVEVA